MPSSGVHLPLKDVPKEARGPSGSQAIINMAISALETSLN